MPNQLGQETSPYLLQHADNPVAWRPWSEDALDQAQREDKPIFLSIGYAACHWCHVMAHESFEDPETAGILNQHFINIKVDREERPDLDNIYMGAVVAMTGHGGWPMSVFLTPDGKPFYSGTYFPPAPRYGMPSFRQILEGIIQAWNNNRQQLTDVGVQVTQHLNQANQWSGSQKGIKDQVLTAATESLLKSYDWSHGGWGQAPKFPQPMAIDFLLRQFTRGNKKTLDVATHALQKMSRGGMYDVVGGGFHRYSTDADWLVPHFEKMLYDNAQLARVYLYAYLLTTDDYYRQICLQTLAFVQREMTHPLGGFFSSLDADSEGEEGKFYVWSYAEIQDLLRDSQDMSLFSAAYGLSEAGNFEGKIVLQRAKSDEDLAIQFDLDPERISQKIQTIHHTLFQVRNGRIRPATDDKILVSWNALMMQAFAEAGRYLNRSDLLATATRNADFLLNNLYQDNRLYRSWREGQARHNAYLEDYASLILALLDLYQADPDPKWYQTAVDLAEQMQTHYLDPQGGFFDTSDDHGPLITRPKDQQDNATPSGNALASYALLILSAYSDRSEWYDRSENMLSFIQENAARYPTSFSYWLCALDFAVGPVQQVAIVSPDTIGQAQALISIVNDELRHRSVLAVSTFPPPPGSPPLLENRPLVQGQPSAYVCQHFTCLMPATSPDELQEQLRDPATSDQ
jgi:uncharacterized protein